MLINSVQLLIVATLFIKYFIRVWAKYLSTSVMHWSHDTLHLNNAYWIMGQRHSYMVQLTQIGTQSTHMFEMQTHQIKETKVWNLNCIHLLKSIPSLCF